VPARTLLVLFFSCFICWSTANFAIYSEPPTVSMTIQVFPCDYNMARQDGLTGTIWYLCSIGDPQVEKTTPNPFHFVYHLYWKPSLADRRSPVLCTGCRRCGRRVGGRRSSRPGPHRCSDTHRHQRVTNTWWAVPQKQKSSAVVACVGCAACTPANPPHEPTDASSLLSLSHVYPFSCFPIP
jgi:hypothetical protein